MPIALPLQPSKISSGGELRTYVDTGCTTGLITSVPVNRWVGMRMHLKTYIKFRGSGTVESIVDGT